MIPTIIYKTRTQGTGDEKSSFVVQPRVKEIKGTVTLIVASC